jgi:hypothetical protein
VGAEVVHDDDVALQEGRDQGLLDPGKKARAVDGEGQGVPQDYAKAYMWYIFAASRFPPGEWRDNAVNNRDIVAKKMTPAQISEAQKLAQEWKPKK